MVLRNREKQPTISSVVVQYVQFHADDAEQNSFALLAVVGQDTRKFANLPAQFMPIIGALRRLHRLGVVHGDARLPNIVYCGARGWMWIDMNVPFHLSSSGFLSDWWCLLKDICCIAPSFNVSSIVESDLSQLYEFDAAGSFLRVVEAAFDAFESRLAALLQPS